LSNKNQYFCYSKLYQSALGFCDLSRRSRIGQGYFGIRSFIFGEDSGSVANQIAVESSE